MATKSSQNVLDLIDATTVVSLFSTLAILGAAWTASLYALPKQSTTKTRILFVWHAFDALIHFFLEGSYLYNCFFTYIDTGIVKGLGHNGGGLSEFLPPNVFFLGRTDRLYGSFYGANPFSALWRVYAQADKRWGGSDLTVISLELLTVFIMAPLAVWVCICLSTRKAGTIGGSEWFWMMVIATGELYGGFMTFSPEWLSGSPNLDTSNFLYLWVYLVFFNTLWVWIPLWILYEAYHVITGALAGPQAINAPKAKKRQ
ncbi:Emopamil-binding protein [Myriangium duriaei CBS 260.36]|uniref:Emopamil-binding protein n=1 Tax=Myriangium duriaei CBS 260.36 TaxID=1168546 RepID=A0A9P4IVD0_9PEZI|nr:Emopamil-binding protein [Myriangium duriaei CBS 260.36]